VEIEGAVLGELVGRDFAGSSLASPDGAGGVAVGPREIEVTTRVVEPHSHSTVGAVTLRFGRLLDGELYAEHVAMDPRLQGSAFAAALDAHLARILGRVAGARDRLALEALEADDPDTVASLQAEVAAADDLMARVERHRPGEPEVLLLPEIGSLPRIGQRVLVGGRWWVTRGTAPPTDPAPVPAGPTASHGGAG